MLSTQPSVIMVYNILLRTIKNIFRSNMKTLKYTVIKTEKQYYEYCDLLEEIDYSDEAEE